MRGRVKAASMVAVLCAIGFWMGACQKASEGDKGAESKKTPEIPFPIVPEQVQQIVADLGPWVKSEQLPKAERKAFEQFCRFLVVRRHCDDAIATKEIDDKKAIEITQPLIDRLAALGKPTEDVLIRLLEARKGRDQEQRRQTLCGEDPEIYGAIVLWNMKSARAVPLFMELAKDARIESRAVFVRGLGRIGDSKALDLLNELATKDTSADVQNEAKTAIANIQKRATPEKK